MPTAHPQGAVWSHRKPTLKTSQSEKIFLDGENFFDWTKFTLEKYFSLKTMSLGHRN